MPTLTPYTGPDLFAAATSAGSAVGNASALGGAANQQAHSMARWGQFGFDSMRRDQIEQEKIKHGRDFLAAAVKLNPDLPKHPMFGYLAGAAETGGNVEHAFDRIDRHDEEQAKLAEAREYHARLSGAARARADAAGHKARLDTLKTLGATREQAAGLLDLSPEELPQDYPDRLRGSMETSAGKASTAQSGLMGRLAQGWERVHQGWERMGLERERAEIEAHNTELKNRLMLAKAPSEFDAAAKEADIIASAAKTRLDKAAQARSAAARAVAEGENHLLADPAEKQALAEHFAEADRAFRAMQTAYDTAVSLHTHAAGEAIRRRGRAVRDAVAPSADGLDPNLMDAVERDIPNATPEQHAAEYRRRKGS